MTSHDNAHVGPSGTTRTTPAPTTSTPATSSPGTSAPVAQPFRVLVTGSRTWRDQAAITTELDLLHAVHGHHLVVVHGACPTGADAIAQTWASTHGVPVEAHPADWDRHGRAAGPLRNAAMVATGPDICLAFIHQDSPGATGCARAAQDAGIPTTRHISPTTTDNSTPAAADDARASAGQDTAPAPNTTVGERTGLPTDTHARRKARAAALDVDGGPVDDEQLVGVVDGPYAGQWFTLTDWRARIAAARYMAQATGTRSPVLDYLPGPTPVPHPYLHEVDGIPAHYAPARHQTAEPTAAACRPRAVGIEPDTDVA